MDWLLLSGCNDMNDHFIWDMNITYIPISFQPLPQVTSLLGRVMRVSILYSISTHQKQAGSHFRLSFRGLPFKIRFLITTLPSAVATSC